MVKIFASKERVEMWEPVTLCQLNTHCGASGKWIYYFANYIKVLQNCHEIVSMQIIVLKKSLHQIIAIHELSNYEAKD